MATYRNEVSLNDNVYLHQLEMETVEWAITFHLNALSTDVGANETLKSVLNFDQK